MGVSFFRETLLCFFFFPRKGSHKENHFLGSPTKNDTPTAVSRHSLDKPLCWPQVLEEEPVEAWAGRSPGLSSCAHAGDFFRPPNKNRRVGWGGVGGVGWVGWGGWGGVGGVGGVGWGGVGVGWVRVGGVQVFAPAKKHK